MNITKSDVHEIIIDLNYALDRSYDMTCGCEGNHTCGKSEIRKSIEKLESMRNELPLLSDEDVEEFLKSLPTKIEVD